MLDWKQTRTQHRKSIDDLRRAIAEHHPRRHQVGRMSRGARVGGLPAETPSPLCRNHLCGHGIQRSGADGAWITENFLECRPRKIMSKHWTARTNGKIPS